MLGNVEGHILSRRKQTYVHYSINQDINAVLFRDRYRSDELILGTPPSSSRPFLVEFT